MSEVSIQTVSNVTRGRFDLMGEGTRQRVEAAMQEIGYYPNHTARGLKQAKTRTLGFLVVDEAPSFMADPLTALLIAGLSDAPRDSNYEVLIRAELPFEASDALVKPLLEGRVDGAAVVLSGDPSLRAEYLQRLSAARAPFVIFDEVLEDPAVLSVRTAERDSSRAMTEHLLEAGHQRIAFVAARIPAQEQAIRLSPRDPQIGLFYSRIGRAHLLQSRIDEAIVWCEKARNATPAAAKTPSRIALSSLPSVEQRQ